LESTSNSETVERILNYGNIIKYTNTYRISFYLLRGVETSNMRRETLLTYVPT
jgi:hypothetical protein